MTPGTDPQLRTVPAAAFALAAMVEAAHAFALGSAQGQSANVPVKLRALSGDPVNHWWWGRIVLDLSGMQLHKDRLPLDWCHDVDQIVGYLDKFDSGKGALDCSGMLTPAMEGDRASQIIAQGMAGVPFEASIYWDELRIEEVLPGGSAQVNGRSVDGPCYVVRQWRLRGVAVCPYGVDAMTSTKFSHAGHADRPVRVHSLSQPPGDTAMSDAASPKPTPAPGSAPGAAPATPTPVTIASEPPPAPGAPGVPEAPGQKYLTAFGEKGATYFAKGLTFEQATAEHVQWQAGRIAELEKQVAAGQAAAPAGAPAVPFSAESPSGGLSVAKQVIRIAGKR